MYKPCCTSYDYFMNENNKNASRTNSYGEQFHLDGHYTLQSSGKAVIIDAWVGARSAYVFVLEAGEYRTVRIDSLT